jgi:hypothetical protein
MAPAFKVGLGSRKTRISRTSSSAAAVTSKLLLGVGLVQPLFKSLPQVYDRVAHTHCGVLVWLLLQNWSEKRANYYYYYRWTNPNHNVCKTVWLSEALLVYGDMTWTLLGATIDSLDELRKWSKISFFVVTHAQSCWTVVDSTKSVSAELSDFGLWRQLKVESEIQSPWTLKY